MDRPFNNQLDYLPANSKSFTTILEGLGNHTVRSSFHDINSLAYLPRVCHSTLSLFVRDGTMYFLVIFMANLLNTLIFLVSVLHVFILLRYSKMLQLAEEDLRVVGAEFQRITSIMISRLVLNLRSVPDSTTHNDSTRHTGAIRFVTGTIGNVELDTFVDTFATPSHRSHMYADDIPYP